MNREQQNDSELPLDDDQNKKLIEFRKRKRDLVKEIPAIWKSATDETGKVSISKVVELVAKRVKELDVLNPLDVAIPLVEHYDRSIRPANASAQGVLDFYDPDAFFPIGTNERMQMSKASREDFVAWDAIDTKEFEASRTAFEQKHKWRLERIIAWTPKDKTLADLEARLNRERDEMDQAQGGAAS